MGRMGGGGGGGGLGRGGGSEEWEGSPSSVVRALG